jgi:hypothetical protein
MWRKALTSILVVPIIFITGIAGLIVGVSWQSWRSYDQYIWRFSEYSTHLRELVEAQRIKELTNAIMVFDAKFSISHSPEDLEDAIFQLKGQGRYIVTRTNASNAFK